MSSSSYLDRILQTEDSEAERSEEIRFLSMETPGEVAPAAADESPWKRPFLTVGYEYGRQDWKHPSHAETDQNQALAEVAFENRSGFTGIVGLRYVREDTGDDFASTYSESNNYVLTLHPSQELLRFLMAKPPQTTGLVFGTLMGYRHSDASADFSGTDVKFDGDALLLVPNLVAWHYFNERLTVSEIALFTFETYDIDTHGGGSDDGSTGVFSLQTRLDITGPAIGDYGNVKFIPSAEWRHDVHRDASSKTSLTKEEDWAEFVAKIRWPLPRGVGLVLQYTLDEFRSDYTTHKVQLGFERALGS